MPQFLFTYHGGHTPDSAEEGQKAMAEWGAWFGAIGDALAVPGAPVGASSTVSAAGVAEGGGENPVSGYSVVNADSMADATGLAKGCPMVKNATGSVEVSEVIEM